ncbi:hypothetical protein J4416_02255 [Candidatus Pacearchaeota archaeon]|nr:hypothetical protein [Candidatus Pacearchaeota archaeon]
MEKTFIEWRNLRNLLKLKPFDFGCGSEGLSEEIDEVLYGLDNINVVN